MCGKTLYRFTHTDVPPVSPTGTETRYLARGRGGQPPSSSSWLALSSMRCCRGWSWYVLLASPSTSVIRLVQRCTPSAVHPVVLIHCTSPVLTSTRRRPMCINLESYFQQPPSLSSQLAFSSLRHSFFSTPFDRFIRRLAAFPFDSLPVVSFIAFHVLLRVLCFLYH